MSLTDSRPILISVIGSAIVVLATIGCGVGLCTGDSCASETQGTSSSSVDQVDDDNSLTGFGGGTFDKTQWNAVSGSIELDASGKAAGSGTFLSRVMDARSSVSWSALQWSTVYPSGKELPDSSASESGYSEGNVNQSQNILLYHMNQLGWNGTANEVVDSSGNSNHGTASPTGGTITTNGRFNSGGQFNGIVGQIQVPSSASLQPTSALSVSLWVKPTSTISSLSTSWQTLFDKASYSARWNANSGTLKFITQNASGGAWSTSYTSSIDQVSAFIDYEGTLYAAVTDFSTATFIDVLYCTPTGGTSDTVCDQSSEWSTSLSDNSLEGAYNLAVYGGMLYAGMGGGMGHDQIYVCNLPGNSAPTNVCNGAAEWSSVYTGSGTGATPFVGAMAVFNDRLYVGFSGDGNGDAKLLSCAVSAGGTSSTYCNSTDGDWVTTNLSATASHRGINSLHVFNGRLYVGLGDQTLAANQANIYVCDPAGGGSSTVCDNASDWSQVRSAAAGQRQVITMQSLQGVMYAGVQTSSGNAVLLSCNPDTASGDDTVCESGEWSVAGTLAGYNSVEGMGVYNGKLYVGLGWSATNGDILVCDPATSGSTNICEYSGDFSTSRANGGLESVATFYNWRGTLYAGSNRVDTSAPKILYKTDNGFVESSTSSWAAATWHHLGLVFDGTTSSIYVNGSLDSSSSTAYTMATSTYPLYIAGPLGDATDTTGASNHFAGIIDEFAIYGRALTASEMESIYLRGVTNVQFQIRSCSDSTCTIGTLIGSDGTASTYFSELQNSSATTLSPLTFFSTLTERYFQYKAILTSESTARTPKLKRVQITPAH